VLDEGVDGRHVPGEMFGGGPSPPPGGS
jgi:hypothetical protein